MKERKAKVKTIKATSRVALHIKDNFYTVEYSEEREIPDTREGEEVDMEFERNVLWDDVNKVVDDQCAEILRTFKN